MKVKSKKISILAAAFLFCIIGLQAGAKAGAKGELNGVVNLNEAGIAELTMLPGIGPAKAQAIRERVKANPFKTVEEIKSVKGIGDTLFAKLKPFVTVSSPTTAKWVAPLKDNTAK